jgi:nucleoside-diphosphate-sugar epimerase
MSLAIVTGAPGWLGTRLVHALVDGLPNRPELELEKRHVRCLVRPDVDAGELDRLGPAVEVVRGDITQASTLEPLFAGAEGASVFHSAGLVHASLRTRSFYDVNVRGTRNLLEAAARAKTRRLVHISSNSPFGTNVKRDDVFDETSKYHPYMMYGKTKMLAEELVKKAHTAGQVETVIVRPPWFYGPGQPARQGLFFRMIRDGRVPVVGDGENRRSMAYVDDICQGVLLAERSERAAGQAYWIADRRAYTMNEVISAIESVLERHFQVRCARKRISLPDIVGRVATAIDAFVQALGFYHQKMHVLGEMNKTIACSIAKAEDELGYKPTVELEEGMRRSIQWMYERGDRL